MTIIDTNPMQDVIYNFMSNFAYQDALFLSERYHCESQTEESLYLLALTNYRSHKTLRAFNLLKNRTQLHLPQSKYLYSKCCFDLHKFSDAETALIEQNTSKTKLYDEILKEYGDLSAFVLQLLACIYSKTDRAQQSIDFHKKSLRLNPFLWSSFEALCNIGEKLDPSKYFTLNSALNSYNSLVQYNNENINPYDSIIPRVGSVGRARTKLLSSTSNLNNLFILKENNTSVPFDEHLPTVQMEIEKSSTSDAQVSATPAPQTASRVLGGVAQKKLVSKRIPVRPLSGQNTGNLANISNANIQMVRRSSRIFAQNANAVKENKKLLLQPNSSSQSLSTSALQQQQQRQQQLHHHHQAQTSSSTSSSTSSQSSNSSSNATTIESSKLAKKLKIKKKLSTTSAVLTTAQNITLSSTSSSMNNSTNNLDNTTNVDLNRMEEELGSVAAVVSTIENTNRTKLEQMIKVIKEIAHGYLNLNQYECARALEYFEYLPTTHYHSSFVLASVGRALFELHDYQKAEKVYLSLRALHPYHSEGLEYFSTVLWHLQKETQLSSLAQELTDYDKLSPETWCVVGNCFSLHKEHDAAIKFFQRATQISPNFVYAYNLLGHEYVLIEEMDKGLQAFRKAVSIDPRHYNAWYGISMINLKQEKFNVAENYLKKALMINQHSSTLMCHIAVVYHSMKKSDKALDILERALEIEPKNYLCKFHRASILFSMEKYELALRDFERLRKQIPKESLIYYMISKTHKKLKNIHLSLQYMSWAMDLDPKGVNNQLKENIDKRYVVDNDSTYARELEAINNDTPFNAIFNNNHENSIINVDTTTSTNNNNNNNDISILNANNTHSTSSHSPPTTATATTTINNVTSTTTTTTSNMFQTFNSDLLAVETEDDEDNDISSVSANVNNNNNNNNRTNTQTSAVSLANHKLTQQSSLMEDYLATTPNPNASSILTTSNNQTQEHEQMMITDQDEDDNNDHERDEEEEEEEGEEEQADNGEEDDA